MEHVFHLFIPGTPENIAMLSVVPGMQPIYHCFICWIKLKLWKR